MSRLWRISRQHSRILVIPENYGILSSLTEQPSTSPRSHRLKHSATPPRKLQCTLQPLLINHIKTIDAQHEKDELEKSSLPFTQASPMPDPPSSFSRTLNNPDQRSCFQIKITLSFSLSLSFGSKTCCRSGIYPLKLLLIPVGAEKSAPSIQNVGLN